MTLINRKNLKETTFFAILTLMLGKCFLTWKGIWFLVYLLWHGSDLCGTSSREPSLQCI